ncbi:ATP-binding domain-containing protein [Rhizobium sullae]|uniref:DNA 3'-5' helicase II n=1 Tax=Rhizobium sullae TaxID=50338 RepID=A0ABY5XHM9_RHISU|nr:ATP-binding domain-containing protein [Rhizobium sullae]UWU14075.1 ATP-binding domain-containing protein [Rhizobium sullae]
MADVAVAAALRSGARLVVIEAPGGCGKTFQGAAFAADICPTLGPGRLLILTHTHAACDVFGNRTRGLTGLEIRTIDSLIGQIAEAYPEPGVILGALPDYDRNSRWAAGLLKRRPFIADMLARRYPMVICDEHQDASPEQHAVIEALHGAGARVRAFFDPMQRIYGAGANAVQSQADDDRLAAFQSVADISESLDVPHRWRGGGEDLGDWILENRTRLAGGGKLRLTGVLPRGLNVVFAENSAQRNLGFRLDTRDRRPLDPDLKGIQSLLILSHYNETVRAIRAYLSRSMPIWEGHTRSALPPLAERLAGCADDAAAAAHAAVAFVQEVCTGFSDSQFATRFRAEVAGGCATPARGKPAQIQALARLIVDQPNHTGVGAFLRGLYGAIKDQAGFAGIHIDYPREFWEAVRLGAAPDPQTGLVEQAHRNAHTCRLPPARAISTIHKAKGLEAPNVLIMPCDGTTFRERDRRLLYVAVSRASRSLTLVVSRSNPSPIIEI